MTVLIVAAVGIIAAISVFARTRFVRAVPSASIDAVGRMSVVIPARNEADSLPRLLASLRGASCREIIVVDDASNDDTASVAAMWGARVVPAGELPPGWAGKPWACHVGVEQSCGELLVFLDADTRLSPVALGHLAGAQSRFGGLVSVQPFHRAIRPYEQLSALFNAAAVLGSGEFAVGLRSPRRAVAFGPCMVTSRSDYDAVGGHSAVRSSVIEDIALAQRYQNGGLATHCLLGGDDVQFRMYPNGLGSLIEGWTKNIALGAGQASRAAVAATVLWIAAMAWVATTAISRWIGWAAGGTFPFAASIAWMAIAVHCWTLLRRLGSFRWTTAVLFPVPLFAFLAVFGRSSVLVALRRPVRWSGRTIATERRGA